MNELSMGQKKKAFMSFALATGTRFLLMDEPTNGLDIPSKSQFRKVIANNMTDERMLIISTHQVHDIESLLDHIVIMNQSHLLLNASVSDICEKYTFEYRTPAEMDDTVLYAEPTLQGNAVIAKRKEDAPETQMLTKRYIAGFGRISGGVANCTNIFADKVAGMPNVVLKMQGEDLSQAGWILMSVPR